MNTFIHILVQLIFLAGFLFRSYYLQETNATECLDNGVSPDDEPGNGTSFDLFSTELERYTGLGQTPFSVILSCGSTPCMVNPNGSAIWEARMHLYLSNMMFNNNGSRSTLDGCLCHSLDAEDFQSCMVEVRESMTAQLDTVLVEKFKEIVESNCTLVEENCSI